MLAAWALLGQSDRIAAEKPGCFVLEEVRLCLASNSKVQLNALAANNVALALERGQVSVHAAVGATPRRMMLDAGEVRVAVETPATFVLELGDESAGVVRARVLRGRLRMTASSQSLDVPERKSAVYRREEKVLDAVELLPGPAQHAWDLVGTGRIGGLVAPMWSGVAEKNRAEPAAASAELPEHAPRELMQDAWELLKAERWQEAAEVYERIAREAPHSEESAYRPGAAGRPSPRALADPWGLWRPSIAISAREEGRSPPKPGTGASRYFGGCGVPTTSAQAIDEFLRFHEKSTEAPQLLARLKVLAP